MSSQNHKRASINMPTLYFFHGLRAATTSPPDRAKAHECWTHGALVGCIPSAAHLGCLLLGTSDSDITSRTGAEELFDNVESSSDFYTQTHLAFILGYGAFGTDVHLHRAEALLLRAAALGYEHVACVVHGRLLMRSPGGPTPAKVRRGADLFYKAAACNGELGCAELGLLHQYGAPGFERNALLAKAQLERFQGFATVCDRYRNHGDVSPRERVFELYYGNLLAFGGNGVERDVCTATAVLRSASIFFPQASILLGFLLECENRSGNEQEAFYSNAARRLWTHVFNFCNRYMSQSSPNTPFSKSSFYSMLRNYNYVGKDIERMASPDLLWSETMANDVADRVDIITMFCLGLMLRHGASPFPKDLRAAKIIFKRASELGHDGAKEMFDNLAPAPAPSPLQQAFIFAISKPSVLSSEYIAKYVRREYVTSIPALFAGHNLVLLFLRHQIEDTKGVNENIIDSWSLRENLYFPASNLPACGNDENLMAFVFRHAEEIGLIRDGFQFRANFLSKQDARLSMHSIVDVLEEISNEVSSINDRLSRLEINVDDVDKNMAELFRGFHRMQQCQRANEEYISDLSSSLNELHCLLKRQKKNGIYAGLAKSLVALIPIVGKSFVHLFDVGAELCGGFTVEDAIGHGAKGAQVAVDKFGKVDLSNFSVANVIFSDDALKKLCPRAKEELTQSVRNSEFKTLEGLRNALKIEADRIQTKRESIYVIDIFKNPWSSTGSSQRRPWPSPSSSPTSPKPSIEHEMKEIARKHFRDETRQSYLQNDHAQMDPPYALNQLNYLLSKDNLSDISVADFEKLFEETGKGTVSEEIFVDFYVHFRMRMHGACILESIKSRCDAFVERKFFQGHDLSIKLAVTYLREFYDEQVRDGLVANIQETEEDTDPIRNAIQIAIGDVTVVSRKSFVKAMLEIVEPRLR